MDNLTKKMLLSSASSFCHDGKPTPPLTKKDINEVLLWLDEADFTPRERRLFIGDL